MSEKTTTQSVGTQLPKPAKPPSRRSIDTDVDRLIEDVFADVDRVLERSSGLPSDAALPKTVSLNPLQIPPIVMRPLVMPHHQATDLTDEDPDKDTVTVKATSSNDEDPLGQLFDRFLVGTACVSLALISGLWLWSRPSVKKFFTTAILGEKVAPAAPVAAVASPSEADQEFVEYINRSLDRINPKLANNGTMTPQANLPAAPNPTTPPLPILSIPFNPAAPDAMAQSLSRIATALEKFSVTALRPPQPANANNPIRPTPASPRPSAATPSPRPSAATPSPRPSAATPSPSPSATTPSPSPVAATPSPSPSPQASAPTPSAAEVASAPEPEAIEPEAPEAMAVESEPEIPSKPTLAPVQEAEPETEAMPANIYALLGILQFGDRSAALFEVNGVPSRVNIGESIGSSGWTLVEVTDQQARIRRNGEVRDIFVGQQF
jgi:Tfp pilus assembly protein PilP